MRAFLPRPSSRWVANLMAETKAANDAGRWKEAARGYATLARLFERHPELAKDGAVVPAMLNLLAIAHSRAGNPKQAVRTYVRLAMLYEKRGEDAEIEYAWEGAARYSLETRNFADGERFAQNAVAVARRHCDASELTRALRVLGLALLEQQRLKEAEAVLRESLEVIRTAEGEDADESRCASYEGLIRTARAAHDHDTAERWMEDLKVAAGRLSDPEARVRMERLQAEVDQRRRQ